MDLSSYTDVSGDGGVMIKLIKPGSGFSPTALSKVEVHFVGSVQGGEEFHSTHNSGHPVSVLCVWGGRRERVCVWVGAWVRRGIALDS